MQNPLGHRSRDCPQPPKDSEFRSATRGERGCRGAGANRPWEGSRSRRTRDRGWESRRRTEAALDHSMSY